MDQETFFIGTLADRAGVTPDAVRFYEDEGVLPEPERSDSGYRLYGPEDVDRLRFIQQAQALGLRLEEIAEILALVEERGIDPCSHVEARLRERLSQVEQRLQELRSLRSRLRSALERAREAPFERECRCRIIEGTEGSTRIEIGGVQGP